MTSKLRIQGKGFEGDGSNLKLGFVPAMAADSYTVSSASESSVTIMLKSGKSWPSTGELGEVTMYLVSVMDSSNPDVNLLEEPVAVATILKTPSVVVHEDRLLYMTGSLKLLVNGSNFRAKGTKFTFDPPLYEGVDYVMTVKSRDVCQLSLKTGRRWRSDGVPGPLKLTRLDTGGGALRIDSKFGGVTVAEVQADLGAHGVTVETTSDKKYYQSSPEVTLLGHGFNESYSSNVLRWGNKLMGKGINYTIVGGSTNTLTLSLSWGSKWRANAANLPGPLTLLAVNAGAGLVPVGATEAKKGRVVGTIYADPSVKPEPLKTVYQTLTHEIWVRGEGFVRGTTALDLKSTSKGGGDLELKPLVDYILVVFNSTHLRVALRDGRKWANGPDGQLLCYGLDTGAGKIATVTKEMPRVLAGIAADAMHKSGASVTRTAMTQTIYETPALKKLTISGSALCADGYRGSDATVVFNPPVEKDTFTVSSATPTKVVLDLKKKKRWPVGTLALASIKCGDKTTRTFADGVGVGVATVLPDPTVEAHPELVLYGAHSRRVVVRGTGFSPEGTELTLEPTARKNYHVVEVTEYSVLLELEDEAPWVDAEQLLKDPAKGIDLKVSKVDTGAGEVRFDDGGVTVATVVREPEGDVCDDSCEWANDGVCDDGTAPSLEDDWGTTGRGRKWDDDFGGYLYDDTYYGGFYDDFYGAYFDDYADLPACPYGTDCTDCQPLHGDAAYSPAKSAECDNTCEFSRDGFCDDTRTNGYCALGTDCQDCGPASNGNFSTYDDDEWWDDDEENWYWDDDYYDDDRRRYDDFYYDELQAGEFADGKLPTKTTRGFDDDATVGYIRSSPNPFDATDDLAPQDGGAASLLVAALLVTALGLSACAAFRVARGGKVCPTGKKDGDTKDSLTQSWQEMTANPASKKTNIPITPDVAYTGDHQA